jgi:hypothetical protein
MRRRSLPAPTRSASSPFSTPRSSRGSCSLSASACPTGSRSSSRSRPPSSCATRPFRSRPRQQDDLLHQTVQLAVRLGQERNAWPDLLDALNEKIPEGVWITQLTPAYDAKQVSTSTGTEHGTHGGHGGNHGGGSHNHAPAPAAGHGPEALGGFAEPTDEINILVVNGLYHVNAKTPPVVDPNSLRDFVQSLSALPLFAIDPQKATEQLTYTTVEADPTAFAEKFTMRLPLKQPIELTP